MLSIFLIREGTEPDIIVDGRIDGLAYTPEIVVLVMMMMGRMLQLEKGTKTSVLDLTGDTLFFIRSQMICIFLIVIFLSNMLLNVITILNIINEKSKKKLEKCSTCD